MSCEVIGETVTGVPVVQYPKELYGKHWSHPLCLLFASRAFGVRGGMDWLQARGHVSDECVWPHDVAPSDVLQIVKQARAEWLMPSVEKLYRCQDLSISEH